MSGLRRCVYCGTYTTGKLACRAHADLPPLDPHYSRDIRTHTADRWAGPTRITREELLPGPRRRAA